MNHVDVKLSIESSVASGLSVFIVLIVIVMYCMIYYRCKQSHKLSDLLYINYYKSAANSVPIISPDKLSAIYREISTQSSCLRKKKN